MQNTPVLLMLGTSTAAAPCMLPVQLVYACSYCSVDSVSNFVFCDRITMLVPDRTWDGLCRRGSAGVQVQGTEIGTTADFLAALEARANSRTAGDAPSHAHR